MSHPMLCCSPFHLYYVHTLSHKAFYINLRLVLRWWHKAYRNIKFCQSCITFFYMSAVILFTYQVNCQTLVSVSDSRLEGTV